MKQNETAQQTLHFGSEPRESNGVLIGFLAAALSGALVGSCLTLLFLLPYLAR